MLRNKIVAGATVVALSLFMFGCSTAPGTDPDNEVDDDIATMDGQVLDDNGEDIDTQPNTEGSENPAPGEDEYPDYNTTLDNPEADQSTN